VPLTPEEIEARRFRLAQNGYDCESVDRFLAEIAEALRVSPEIAPGTDEFGRLGQEIAAILRNARDSAGAIRAEAEGQAAALRSRAEVEVAERRKVAEVESARLTTQATDDADAVRAQAEAEAAETRDRARSELDAITAEAQRAADIVIVEAEAAAATLLVDAEAQVREVREAAEREAAARLDQAEHEARRHAEEITADARLRAESARETEQSTYLRLLASRDDVQQAIDRLVLRTEEGGRGADEAAPSVLDLTTAPAQVRTGANAESGGGPGSEGTARPSTRPVASVGLDPASGGGVGDPLLRMVRAAVGRAAEGSAQDDEEPAASAS